jgi:CheY-like chemotaxis protein
LLAEDVELNRDIICTILARSGHQVVTAENGRDAVDRVREQPFDLVLMDVHMPVMDGLDATRAIRSLPGSASAVPVVALTANVMASEQEKCRQAGMDLVLMKPVEWDKVQAAIRDCARLREQRDHREQAPNPPEMVNHDSPEEVAFDDAIFAEVGRLISPARLVEHAAVLTAAVEQLAASGPRNDLAKTRNLAHSIVSQAGMLGLTRLSASAAAVEEACDDRPRLCDALRRMREVSADLADYLHPRLSRLRT